MTAIQMETIGESFAMPHDATSLEELELIVTRLGMREHRWETYRLIAKRTGVSLAPDEMWLLVQLCRDAKRLPATWAIKLWSRSPPVW